MRQSESPPRPVAANPSCRACGSDLALDAGWADANGQRYCADCIEALRGRPPYQAPLFRCTTCERAWPLRTLAVRAAGELACRDCAAGAPPAAAKTARPGKSDGRGRAGTAASAAAPGGKRLAAAPPAPAQAAPEPVEPWGPLGPPPGTILQRLTCPHCWHVFPVDELLWVSRHAELTGDPVLGAEAALRFRPSRFTAAGEALDARDTPCQTLACPRCHLVVPRSVTQLPPLFVSVIGAPASGKSYYLTSMVWELRRVMRDRFGVTFNDADAGFNQILNDYEETLFLRDDPDDLVAIRKTELQGAMYDQVRFGSQVVLLPKPFLFTMRPTRPPRPGAPAGWSQLRMLCVYDNAGEHFQPGMDTVSMPGTQHLAHSRALWFVFDPTQHPRFRAECRSVSQDPQLTQRSRTQRQEVLLNETADRVRRYTGLPADKKHNRPLIVIVSKADIWSRLLGVQLAREPLLPDPFDSALSAVDVDRVEKVSAAIRELLKSLTPEFVAAAEDFCSHVAYVPASALGRGPAVDERTGGLGIRPRDIIPQWVTVPALYMMAKWANGWIPGVRADADEDAAAAAADCDGETGAAAPAAGGGRRRNGRRPTIVRPGGRSPEQVNLELVYTSAPRGLRPGSVGFCTVAMTGGTPAALVERLEALSAYDAPAGGEPADAPPRAACAHWRVAVGTRVRSVLSRIVPAGQDYSGRANKLAWHVVAAPGEQPPGGPAWALLQLGAVPDAWSGEPRLLPAGRRLPAGDAPPAPCHRWAEAAGDAGWAGVLAEALLRDAGTVCYVVHPPAVDPLPLLAEALALLPPAARWRVTFHTAFTSLPVDLACAVRCVSAGSPTARDLPAAGALVLDLTRRDPAPDSPAARAARQGLPLGGDAGTDPNGVARG